MLVDAGAAGANAGRLRIAVVGTGIAGLSAGWLLAHAHDVTLFEAERRIGGHSHTVETPSPAGPLPVDAGFIVYNEQTYPNLTALFSHLRTPTRPSEMSFSVSLADGRREYASAGLAGLFAQRQNIVNPRFWAMLLDTLRFYRSAPGEIAGLGLATLGEYLDARGYGEAFRRDHLYPMAAAIWSLPPAKVADYPAAAFIGFCQNHGLLQIGGRPQWRTVAGGARTYLAALSAPLMRKARLGARVRAVRRAPEGIFVACDGEAKERFDRVVIGAHADQAVAMLADATIEERRILGAFRYSRNRAVVHQDPALTPRRRKVWSSWNYLAGQAAPSAPVSITYWMNRLQGLPEASPRFVSLNPMVEPRADLVFHRCVYEHPLFDRAALGAQERLWSLQGCGGVWFCGAYFGAGFHEDALQSGLAVAEAIGGVRRPWRVANESGRIKIDGRSAAETEGALVR
jgi:hypothetical protein